MTWYSLLVSPCLQWDTADAEIIIIMYIYHALINALSTHIIHINLNTVFYTHVEDSPTKTVYLRRYMETHTHTHTHTRTLKALYGNAHTHTCTHNDCSKNWVLILVGAEILWEEDGFQSGFKRWQGWAVSKIIWEWIPNVGSKAREGVKVTTLTFCIAGFSACGCRKKSIVSET